MKSILELEELRELSEKVLENNELLDIKEDMFSDLSKLGEISDHLKKQEKMKD